MRVKANICSICEGFNSEPFMISGLWCNDVFLIRKDACFYLLSKEIRTAWPHWKTILSFLIKASVWEGVLSA